MSRWAQIVNEMYLIKKDMYLFVDISGLCLFRNFVLAPAPGLVRTKL